VRRGIVRGLLTVAAALFVCACSKSSSAPTPPATPPPPATAAVTITFDENPVAFRSTGCSFATPQGWYAQARIQETAGVAVTVTSLTQRLDGAANSNLAESFNSRFGACAGGTFTAGTIPASGTVCGVVGVCTTASHGTYQFSITGTDANAHAVTFDSPVLRFNPRP
jgi:hypothetical protein